MSQASEPLRIRRTEPEDAADLQAIFSHPDVVAGTLQLPFPSLRIWRQKIETTPEHLLSLVAEVQPKQVQAQVIGNVTLEPFLRARRTHAATIGIVIHHAWQNRGVGTTLLAAVLDLADQWHHLKRIELTVFADNQAAIALYKKFGFEIEGTLRAFAVKQGQLCDVYAMARVV